MKRHALLLIIALFIFSRGATAQSESLPGNPFSEVFAEISPGVWVGRRTDVHQIPVMGNTTFVIGDEGVIVFDGGGAPLMSEQTLAKIKELTDLPVTHLVVSHWHIDHSRGISVIVDDFPNVQVIAHRFTREFIVADLENRRTRTPTIVPGFIAQTQEMFATNTDPDGGALSAQDRKWYEEAVANAELIDQEYRRAKPQVPNLTFEDELTLHSGQREIRLLHYGRGNTGGDVIMWLPRERILAAGDLVVSPTPFGGGSYPREWAEVLRKMNALGYETLVPGHGEVQHDTRYVDQLIQVLDFVSTEVPALLAAGATQDQLVDRMDFSPFEIRFTGHDEFLQARFRGYFVEPIVEAAYLLETGEQPETKPLPYTPPSEPKVK